jgi:TonB family protein
MLRCGRIPHCLVLVTAFCFLAVGSSFAQVQQNLSESNPPYGTELKALAARILKRADQAECRSNNCTVLVTNFTTPSGSTSRLGIQMADSISTELLSQGQGIRIVDRSRLRDYLIREHIPSNLLKDWKAARWLAFQLQANAVLVGSIEQQGDRFDLLVELLNASNEKIGSEEAIDISVHDPQGSLAPFEPYDAERPGPAVTSAQGYMPTRAGINGVSVPECIYCPAPLYSNAARKAKFKGTVVLEVTVTEDGLAGDISVLKGIPFGLNGEAIKAVRAWKFKPANDKGGMPMTVAVPIEMTFNLS